MDTIQEMPQILEYDLSPADYQQAFALVSRKQARANLMLILGCLFLLIGGWFSAETGFGLIALCVFVLILAIRSTKALKQQKAKLPTHPVRMRWELYETDFGVSIYRDGVLTHYIRRKYTDIAGTWQDGDLYTLQLDNTRYILPVTSAPGNSPLLAAMKRNLKVHGQKTKLESWGNALFGITLASLLLFSLLPLLLADFFGGYQTEYMHLMWQGLPIPIVCIVLGFVLKKRGFAWKRNVVCGILVAAVLLVFGSFGTMFQPEANNGEAFLARVEQETGLDFPDVEFSNVTNYASNTHGNDRIFILSDYYGSLSSYSQKDMNQQLPGDSRWLQGVPYQLLPCIPLNNIQPDADFFLLYDATTGMFNTFPTTPGTHTLFYITYYAKYGSLEIVEYEYTCN